MDGGWGFSRDYLSSKVELQSKRHLFLNLLSQTYRRSCEKKSEEEVSLGKKGMREAREGEGEGEKLTHAH